MKNISVFSSENFQVLDAKISIYLKGRVFVMRRLIYKFGYGGKENSPTSGIAHESLGDHNK